jgi:hypothetical protein
MAPNRSTAMKAEWLGVEIEILVEDGEEAYQFSYGDEVYRAWAEDTLEDLLDDCLFLERTRRDEAESYAQERRFAPEDQKSLK